MGITSSDRIVAQSISWLWPGRIPLGKLVILDGDPDLGKSLIALDLCARLSTGRPFPDGAACPGPANALVLSAEDGVGDTVVPRLRRLGADLPRVFVWQRECDDEAWPWRFPTHLGRLDEALGRSKARLAVIDPIMAFLDDRVLCASDASVRRVLSPLIQLAEKHQSTLLMHRHLNKQGGGRAVYRGLGSIGFLAACRTALLVGRHPREPGRCVLAPVRGSLGAAPPSLAYRLAAADGELPTVEWLGPCPLGADDLLAGAPAGHGARDQAAEFLQKFLAAGPRTSRELWQAAREAGHTPRTLQRAKLGLGIRSRRVTEDRRPVSYWLLPGQELPAGTVEPEIDRMLAELEKQYPPPTPLDDEEFDEDRE